MDLIANWVNGTYLREILPGDDAEIDSVLASVAYGSDTALLKNCLENRVRLDIWMRYDHTVPVSPSMLREFLKYTSKNIFCYQIPDRLHSKVVWWKGYGAYIGSANLTDRAWNSNIEAGLFFPEGEMHQLGLVDQLDEYFEQLAHLEESFPLTLEVVEELDKIAAARREIHKIDEASKKLRKAPVFEGANFVSKKSAYDSGKERFRIEWGQALTYLRSIADEVVNHRPGWVEENVPAVWQADQMLHAYYYNKVRDGNRHPFEEFHQSNKSNPAYALKEVLQWWQGLSDPPTSEDGTFYESAPFIRKVLSRDHILDLSLEEFTQLCRYTHATKDHLIKVPLSLLGVVNKDSLSKEERVPLFAKWLWDQHNAKGESVVQLLNYILYGGPASDMWERIYAAAHERSISHSGINSIGEVVGWALRAVLCREKHAFTAPDGPEVVEPSKERV